MKRSKSKLSVLFTAFSQIVFVVCAVSGMLSAQEPVIILTDSLALSDTIVVDTTIESPRIIKIINAPFQWVGKGYTNIKNNYPHPKTAAYFALAFPGGGQLYNKDFWKVPIVWGGYGLVGYSIYFNTTQYRGLKQAVLDRINMVPDQYPFIPTLQALRLNRDAFRKDLELAYIGLFAVHVLSAIEAYVACHLKGFDISDDLSIRFKPGIDHHAFSYTNTSVVPKLGISIQFK